MLQELFNKPQFPDGIIEIANLPNNYSSNTALGFT
jgi:hypothetical protein